MMGWLYRLVNSVVNGKGLSPLYVVCSCGVFGLLFLTTRLLSAVGGYVVLQMVFLVIEFVILVCVWLVWFSIFGLLVCLNQWL